MNIFLEKGTWAGPYARAISMGHLYGGHDSFKQNDLGRKRLSCACGSEQLDELLHQKSPLLIILLWYIDAAVYIEKGDLYIKMWR